jgi:NAD(P)-dependent dehydrogenase (short-subunit alcohol dehydrogenase family)
MADNSTIAVVTGGSRGAGLGIAHALGSHGCTVYVTGRTTEAGQKSLRGTIHETAAMVTAAGGRGIAVAVDHADDEDSKALFAQVARDHGRVDILVNNAAIIRDEMMGPTKFWQDPINVIDNLDVGLRSSYVATVLAAPLMIPQRKGLVVFTSASGAVHYQFGPAYGVVKAGTDKMAADMAIDFADEGVAAVSIWMGTLLTQRVRDIVAANPALSHVLDNAETPELTGHVIWSLFNDPDLMRLSGRTLIGAELAAKYAINDEGGRQPASCRDVFGFHPALQSGQAEHEVARKAINIILDDPRPGP